MPRHNPPHWLLAAATLLLAAYQSAPQADVPTGSEATAATAELDTSAVKVVALDNLPGLDAMVPRLADKRVVFVGEEHGRYQDHLAQLDVIRALHRLHPDIAIGMEQFQKPFQRYLDDYIAGRIDEAQMLRKTEYYDRWRFDYRLYRPILRYAREHHIPVIALNVPDELVTKVAQGGMAALSDAERKELPQHLTPYAPEAKERLRAIFDQHPHEPNRSLDHFIDAQLLWDEGMAKGAADWLRDHPGRPMVVLAGIGHLQYGSGIPRRLIERLPVDDAILLNNPDDGLARNIADFILLPPPRELPPSGRFGILMEQRDGAVVVSDFDEHSAAREAGVEKGDVMAAIDGQPITGTADVRIAMQDRRPGDTVQLTLKRTTWIGSAKTVELTVTLR